MVSMNNMFLFLAIFYSVMFGMLSLVPTEFQQASLVEQDWLMPDSFLLSECEYFAVDFWTYYECGDYQFSTQQVLSINDTHIIIDKTDENPSFFEWAIGGSEWGGKVLEFFDNINTRISGLHPVFQIILWGPLTIILIWLIIQLTIDIIPFIGGKN